MNVAQGMTGTFGELISVADDHYRTVIHGQIKSDEQLLYYCTGMSRPHFLIRILPFVPDLLTRGKKYLLVCTNKQVLILRMTNPLNKLKLPEFKHVEARIAFDDVANIIPRTGPLTSRIALRTRPGRTYMFSDLLKSKAEEFAKAVQSASLTQ